MKHEITIEFLEENLPSGSGFDCDWIIEDIGDWFEASSSYHCMHELGYYDGYADFSIIIPKDNYTALKLTWRDGFSEHMNDEYDLTDYIEETVYNHITDAMSGK